MSDHNKAMLHVEDLTVELVNPATASFTQILHGISLKLEPGQVLGVTGPSGGGKSTLVSTLAGLLPDSARVSANAFETTAWEDSSGETSGDAESRRTDFGGADFGSVDRLSARVWQARLQSKLGSRMFVISQDARSTLFPHRTIAWHLKRADSVASRQGSPTRSWTPAGALAAVGFNSPEQYLTRLPGQVSTGECQRVQLAMAGRLPLSFLLADEPFASVDPERTQILARQLRQMAAAGLSVLLVTHDLELLQYAADSLLVIHQGRVAVNGTPDTLLVPDDVPHALQPVSTSTDSQAATSAPADDSSRGMTDVVVRAESLSKVFRNSSLWGKVTETTALRDRSITVPVGSRMALLGDSGSGKTTFARIVMNLDTVTTGSLSRYPLTENDESWNNHLSSPRQYRLWQHFQMVYQDTDLIFDPAARLGDALVQVARVAFPERSTTELWSCSGQWLHRFGLPDDALLAPVTRLSGGEKRRAAIVRSLLAMRVDAPSPSFSNSTEPTVTASEVITRARRLLILDEPTVGLDRFWQDMLIDELINVQRDCGLTYLVISHDPQFVARFCNHVVEWKPCRT